ncbi:pyridoxal phosphate-dependent aminotransferase [Kitasatospora sp. NPDC058063]|uniref:pyridoxal phosphate-dependent aminotransferase n=1 Tax=unclassified Kitasatospora TaxID=2633591 RepID=UPI0036D80B1A
MKTRPWTPRPAAAGLFDRLPAALPEPGSPGAPALLTERPAGPAPEHLRYFTTEALAELRDPLECARDPHDAEEALRLFVGRAEAGPAPLGSRTAELTTWAGAARVRRATPADLRTAPAAPKLVKSIFDFYFRDDLYGHWADQDPIMLSSGSYDETVFGLPESLKNCVRFALDRNWYGYSDSLGRTSAREALAALETARSGGLVPIGPERVAVTLGGTAALASIVDLLAGDRPGDDRAALCAVPNYPPLVAALARKMAVEFVDTPVAQQAERGSGHTDIGALVERARAGARLILLQTVTNPSGLRVPEEQLAELIAAAPADCMIILDECHDAFGPGVPLTPARLASNVISFRSISKRWGAPGLKAGWLVAAPEFIDEFYVHASTTYGGPPSLFYLLLEMLGLFEAARLEGSLDSADLVGRLSVDYQLSRSALEAGFADYLTAADLMSAQVTRCRELVVDALTRMGVPVVVPEYSINLLARIGDEPSYRTYRRLVSEIGVSVYPGLLCLAGGPGLVRLSPCLPEPVLEDAMGRLAGWTERNL